MGTGFWVDMSVWRMLICLLRSVGFRFIAHRSAHRREVEGGCPYLLHTGGVPARPRVCPLPGAHRVDDPGGMKTITSRVARAERPLLLTGLALVTAHLLDLALSGADTSVLGVAVIVAVAAAWALAQPHVTRPTRLVLGVVVGLVAVGFGVVSHGLHVANSGLDWRDVTGIGYIVGGLLLVAAGIAATAAPRRAPSRTGLGWRGGPAGGWGGRGAGAARGGGPRARADRAWLARCPRGRLGRRCRGRRRGRRAAVRLRQHGDARSALGDPRVGRRDPT